MALPLLFCRCIERPSNEVIPFDETLKTLSQFAIGHTRCCPCTDVTDLFSTIEPASADVGNVIVFSTAGLVLPGSKSEPLMATAETSATSTVE